MSGLRDARRRARAGTPVGGWLYVPAAGLAATVLLYSLAALVKAYKTLDAFAMEQQEAALGSVFELLLLLAFLGLTFTAAQAFFRRKRWTPAIVVVLLGVQALVAVAGFAVEVHLESVVPAAWVRLAYHLSVAAVWIPYFLASRRVKETFVL